LVEIKAIKQLTNIESAQVINYLRATDMPRAILLNFGETSLVPKRFINTKP
jgi:GxxExxY protein